MSYKKGNETLYRLISEMRKHILNELQSNELTNTWILLYVGWSESIILCYINVIKGVDALTFYQYRDSMLLPWF